MSATSSPASFICAMPVCSTAWVFHRPMGRRAMLPEVERFKLTLREHAQRKGYAVALWGDNLRLDYATLYSEVVYRQQRQRSAARRVGREGGSTCRTGWTP